LEEFAAFSLCTSFVIMVVTTRAAAAAAKAAAAQKPPPPSTTTATTSTHSPSATHSLRIHIQAEPSAKTSLTDTTTTPVAVSEDSASDGKENFKPSGSSSMDRSRDRPPLALEPNKENLDEKLEAMDAADVDAAEGLVLEEPSNDKEIEDMHAVDDNVAEAPSARPAEIAAIVIDNGTGICKGETARRLPVSAKNLAERCQCHASWTSGFVNCWRPDND
jgi:hypothetical protein